MTAVAFDEILAIASNSRASKEDVHRVLINAEPYALEILSGNPAITLEATKYLFPRYYTQLSCNPTFLGFAKDEPAEILDLFRSYPESVELVHLNYELALLLINNFTAEEELATRTARNPFLPKEFHQHCLGHYNPYIRRGLAANQSIEIKDGTLKILAGDNDPEVRQIVAVRMDSNSQPKALSIKEPDLTSQNPAASDDRTQDTPATAIQATAAPESSPNYPLVILAVVASLMAFAGISNLSNSKSKVPTLSSRGTVVAPSQNSQVVTREGNNEAGFEKAIELANAATAKGKQATGKKGKLALVEDWNQVVSILEAIGPDNPQYNTAQEKLRNYRNIIAILKAEAGN